VAEQAAVIFDQVLVAVVGNPQKRSGMFPIPLRIQMVELATAHLSNLRCIGHDGLTVDLFRAEGADVLIRCAHKDTGNERSMAAINDATGGVPTFFATPDPAARTISSSLVRGLLSTGDVEAAGQLVPSAARDLLTNWSSPEALGMHQ
jgi:pantetheine-phosphate adenylyltransferase